MMVIEFVPGRGILSALIRWQSRSRWSHVALRFDGGELCVEAWPGIGVRQWRGPLRPGAECCRVPWMFSTECERAKQFALGEAGSGYDWRGVLSFVTRGRSASPTRWFCSELVFAAHERAGTRLLRGVRASEVSPETLSLSTYLVPCSADGSYPKKASLANPEIW